MISVLVGIALLGQDKPALDRSAEGDLKQLFEYAGTVKNVHIVIESFSRTSSDWYMASGTGDLHLGSNGQFRFEYSGNRGGPTLYVCDGATLMTDPLSDDDTIVLKRATQKLHEIASREFLAFLLAGTAGFEKTVSRDDSIKFTTAPAGQKAIDFRSKDLGRIVVTYTEGYALPTRIDSYRSQRRADEGAEQQTPATMQYIRVVAQGELPKHLFSAEPPKGKKVDDQRTKTG